MKLHQLIKRDDKKVAMFKLQIFEKLSLKSAVVVSTNVGKNVS